MRVRIWGVRGSLPTPLSNAQYRAKVAALLEEASPEDLATPESRAALLDRSQHGFTFGGNTSCVEISFGDSLFILDAGSGISQLSAERARDPDLARRRTHLFCTHFHWDHICGLPFYGPIYGSGQELDIWSGRKDAEDLLRGQMSSAHFPAKWDRDVKATIRFHVLEPGVFAEVDGARVSIMRLNHPDLAFGYRFEMGGRIVCYLTDTEVSKNPHEVADTYAAFVDGADLVIVDAMYGFLEYHDWINFGHSTIFNWIDFFGSCKIGELVIFHHDRLADDPAVYKLLASARKYHELVAQGVGWTISAACEGQQWEWEE